MPSLKKIHPPRKIDPEDKLESFDSGSPVLDHWLKKRALANEAGGASRTYVVCEKKRVVAFYSLAVGAVEVGKATGKTRRNMPDPVPVMVLARLAVDREFQNRGLGRGMIKDAVLRTLQAAEIGGIRAILVHALDEEAKSFYQRHGFRESPVDPLTLMITIKDAARILSRG